MRTVTWRRSRCQCVKHVRGRFVYYDPLTPAHVALYHSVLVLAAQDGTVQERLARAYTLHLESLEIAGLHKHAQEKLKPVLAELRALNTVGISSLSREKAVTLAMRLLIIYDESTR
jgi:hypothetical protein